MRETRPSGSEGGVALTTRHPYPYPTALGEAFGGSVSRLQPAFRKSHGQNENCCRAPFT